MALSILPFKLAIPGRAVRLLAVALTTWGVGAFYTLRVNPEIAFLHHGDAVKRAWAQKLERDYKSKIVIFGGSSCATSINGERMLERNSLPLVNLGLNAGMGAKILTRYALHSLRTGDTLIMAMEPDLLTVPLNLEPLGVQFSLATGNAELLRNHGRISWPSALLDLRPGGYHTFTLLGKIAFRQPLYRYEPREFHASGWQEVIVKREFPLPPAANLTLSKDAKELLTFIRTFCAQRGVRVAYSLPWGYRPPANRAPQQLENLNFLYQVSEFLPVLRQPSLGVHTVRDHFADTPWHLTTEGAALRTDELAGQIKVWETWSRAELQNPSSKLTDLQ